MKTKIIISAIVLLAVGLTVKVMTNIKETNYLYEQGYTYSKNSETYEKVVGEYLYQYVLGETFSIVEEVTYTYTENGEVVEDIVYVHHVYNIHTGGVEVGCGEYVCEELPTTVTNVEEVYSQEFPGE